MRARQPHLRRIIAVIALLTGALTMTAAAQEKKDPPKKADGPWTEKVTVKRYAGQKDFEFSKPHENVDAYRKTIGKDEVIVLRAAGKGGTAGGKPKPKSEITDAAGNVYRVDKLGGGTMGDHFCYVTKIKDGEKKDDKKPE